MGLGVVREVHEGEVMPILVTCLSCGSKLNAPDSSAGKYLRCPIPQCGAINPIPEIKESEVVEALLSPSTTEPEDLEQDDYDDDRPRSKRLKHEEIERKFYSFDKETRPAKAKKKMSSTEDNSDSDEVTPVSRSRNSNIPIEKITFHANRPLLLQVLFTTPIFLITIALVTWYFWPIWLCMWFIIVPIAVVLFYCIWECLFGLVTSKNRVVISEVGLQFKEVWMTTRIRWEHIYHIYYLNKPTKKHIGAAKLIVVEVDEEVHGKDMLVFNLSGLDKPDKIVFKTIMKAWRMAYHAGRVPTKRPKPKTKTQLGLWSLSYIQHFLWCFVGILTIITIILTLVARANYPPGIWYALYILGLILIFFLLVILVAKIQYPDENKPPLALLLFRGTLFHQPTVVLIIAIGSPWWLFTHEPQKREPQQKEKVEINHSPPPKQELPPFQRAKTPPSSTDFPGLIAYWSLDEGNGTEAFDSVKHKLASLKGCRWVSGIRGKGLKFNGTSDSLEFHELSELKFKDNDSFTFACWVNTATRSGTIFWLLGAGKPGESISLVGVQIVEAKLRASVRRDTGIFSPVKLNGNELLRIGEWHHVALTRDGLGKIELFQDGKSVEWGGVAGVTETKGSITPVWGALGVDRHAPNMDIFIPDVGFLNGSLDEFCVFNRVLTAGEIKKLAGRD
jgi:hypothetical protein